MTPTLPPRLGIVVGLRAEARLVAAIADPARIAISGATSAGAKRAAAQLIARGATHLLSFGFAAGLDETLRPGTLLIPAEIVAYASRYQTDPALSALFGPGVTGPLLHSDVLVADRADKQALRVASGCAALDMESGAVAIAASQAGLPFAVVRTVCDSAGDTLPHAARVSLRDGGSIDGPRIAASILCRPAQLPALMRLSRDVRAAQAGLRASLSGIRA
jgi:adenosylhomocysteine nucleosidase